MQVFEAVNQFKESYRLQDNPWKIKYDESRCQYFIYKIPSYIPIENLSRDDRFITKQRGGIRYLSSLNSAVNIIRQIGQDKVEVSL